MNATHSADHALERVVEPVTRCKCCSQNAALYGLVDFHKSCEIARGREVLPLSGVPVYYHRCPGCHFIFTTAFDHLTAAEVGDTIYNAEYALVDPDFEEARPRATAGTLNEMFGATRGLRILDYGGGNGKTARYLRQHGFLDVTTYDPFVPAHSNVPSGSFDLVISFEVVEHSPDPVATFREMDGFLAEGGMILFSTLVQPPDIDDFGVGWWYAAPRNGHVSLHSRASITRVVQPYGYTFGSFSDGLHALFRRVPAFAAHLLRAAA